MPKPPVLFGHTAVTSDSRHADRRARARGIVVAHRTDDVVPTRVVDASRWCGANAARNESTAAARGAIVLVCDCDDVVGDEWADHYWLARRDGPPSVAAEPVELSHLNDARSVEWGLELDAPQRNAASMLSGWGANMGFHRSV